MPRSPNRTAAVAVNPLSLGDDEDNDICPVCDGDCTCNNRPLLPAVSHGSARFVTAQTASMRSSAHAPAAQPLKIKLTVPSSIQNKARPLRSAQKKSRTDGALPSSGVAGSSSASSHLTNTSSAAGHGQHSASDIVGPKRKGRPPKPVAMVRDGTASEAPNMRTFGNVATSLPQSSVVSRATLESSRFLTFVSANGLTSEASDSSDSDSDTSGFGSDLSLAIEEESYIVAEQRRRDKARVRRELLGDDVPKYKDPNNRWVIRPRKKSVSLSDVDMEGDTDDITEEDEDEEMDEEDDDEDDEADDRTSRVYTGLATGWSDDEESSFDADLFFANLTDTSSDDGASESDGSHPHNSTTDPLASSIDSLRSVDLEVKESWDGQVVFTNGSNDGRGVLDLAFEANAAQLLASDSLSDVEMRTSNGAEDNLGDRDSDFGVTDGETTEEELVDEQGLPTSRAMKLFQWPSVSSIDPMSTVSPNISPAQSSMRHRSLSISESPCPADILAGKFFWERLDQMQPGSAEGNIRESPHLGRVNIPIMGEFSLEGNSLQKAAILTGASKDVPSPYPRVSHRRRRFSSSAGSFGSENDIGLSTLFTYYSNYFESD